MGINDYSLESRVSRVETQQARHDERLSDLDRRLADVTPLISAVVGLTSEIKNVREGLQNVREDLHIFVRAAEERERDSARDRLAYRRWIIGLGFGLLFALIGAAAVIISAHP